MEKIEPEREMIRGALPFAPPALLVALLAGAILGGRNAGVSATLGVAVVLANFVVHGWSLSRAARISLTAVYAVGLGGVVVRLAAIVGIMFALDQLEFFSPLAFVLAVIPTTALLLLFEMRQLRGRLQIESWNFSPRESVPR